MTLALAGCSAEGPWGADSTGNLALAQTVDLAGEIGKKWQTLGGVGVVGNATSGELDLPGAIGKYQTFDSGVIVYSEAHLAVYLTHAIFNEWLALQGVMNGSGEDLFLVVRLPIKDFERFSHPQGVLDMASFEGGRLVVEPGQPVQLIYGPIYYRYLQVETDATPIPPLAANGLPLGLPRDVERPIPDAMGGESGRSQKFEFGEIFWKRSLNSEGVVMYLEQTHGASKFGQIYSYYMSKGGPYNVPDGLGLPLASPELISLQATSTRRRPLGWSAPSRKVLPIISLPGPRSL